MDTAVERHSGPWVSADGREHYPRDGEETWRDSNGSLRGPDGKFASDPYRRSEVDIAANYGDTRTHELSDAAQAKHKHLVAEQGQAKEKRDRLIQHRDELAAELGVTAKDLNRQNLRATIAGLNSRALEAGDTSRLEKIAALRSAAIETSEAIWAVVNRAELAGMNGARDVLPQNALILTGREGDGPGRANTLDLVALVPGRAGEEVRVLILEAKGFGSSLGSRMVDGLRVQQGTQLYRDWMLRNDQALQQARQELARDNPELARAMEQAIAARRIDYMLVHVELDRVTVTEFLMEGPQQALELGADRVRTPELVRGQWREQARTFLREADTRFAESVERQIEAMNQQPVRAADQHQREQELAYRREAADKLRAHAAQYRETLRALAAGDLEKVAAVLKYYGKDPDARLSAESPVRDRQAERSTAPPVVQVEVNRGPDVEPVRVPYDSQERRDTYIAIRMWQGVDVRALDIVRLHDVGAASPLQAQSLRELREREAAQIRRARTREGNERGLSRER
ncbi:hypothetical protein [Nocardia sp. Marseille-Q1738]